MAAEKRACSGRLLGAGVYYYSRQCSKPAHIHEQEQWWCTIHAPSKVAERVALRASKLTREVEDRARTQKAYEDRDRARRELIEAAIAWEARRRESLDAGHMVGPYTYEAEALAKAVRGYTALGGTPWQ